ncbi:hypothetical protein ELQ35_10930 [Peribacillus cavernae]|uniref:Uncharacterized protein n=1 Tax=Peribacillus cavernae TaxID=1674310 RepID=A0A433HKJ8_9BACI|nr:hypothetical protein [Peribacillus cavernae]MDQ0217991.1 hypothetical protein [Peribacillus cavernae]RUQ28961.1 hypothetical protein ELQ35_10930 [Peribacillus cavernae]
MFDPTAFENMKVVLEGAIYDKEFYGEVSVTNRKDIVNLSALSRQYEIEITLPENRSVKASLFLEADIENLTSELLGNAQENDTKAGCTLTVAFSVPFQVDQKQADHLIGSLEAIWGKKRIIKVSSTVQYTNAAVSHASYAIASVSFDRLVKEEQMDDLLTMVDYMVDSLSVLENLQNNRK